MVAVLCDGGAVVDAVGERGVVIIIIYGGHHVGDDAGGNDDIERDLVEREGCRFVADGSERLFAVLHERIGADAADLSAHERGVGERVVFR